MELVIAAVVLAGGIVAAALVFGRRAVVPADGLSEQVATGEDDQLREREQQLVRSAERSQSLERSLDRRSTDLERRERELEARAAQLDIRATQLEKLHEEHTRALERIAGLSAGQAKQALLKDIEDQARHDSARIIRQVEEETKRDAERRVRSILSVAMQRLAASHAAETTVSVVQLPSDDMKGRIIGREGRNIRALENLTGVDFIIDDTPQAVVLSSFDGVRREVAKQTLAKLVADGRIHPSRIEETYYQAKTEIEEEIVRAGVGVEDGLLPHLGDVGVELGLGLVEGLLDPGRVDAPVLQQLLERQPRDLAPHPVEAGEDDGAGRVVDDEIHAGQVLERADVAALPADDAALHVVGGQVHDRHRGLGRVPGGQALHDDGEDVAHAALGVALGLLLDLAHEPGGVVARALLDLREQDLLGLGDAQAGHALELAQVLLLALVEQLALAVELAGPVVERLAPLVDLGQLGVQRALAGEQLLLGAPELAAALAQLGLDVGARRRWRRCRRCRSCHGRGVRIASGGGPARDRSPRVTTSSPVDQGGGDKTHSQNGRRDHDLHVRSSPRRPGRPGRHGVAL